MWSCPNCHKAVDDEFDVCWNCGTSVDGTPDPDFKLEDETPLVCDDDSASKLEATSSRPGCTLLSTYEEELSHDPRRLVNAASFRTPTEAWMARNVLADAGILAFVADDNVSGAYWIMMQAIGWTKVQVRECDLRQARVILSERPSVIFPRFSTSAGDSTCPTCGSTEVYRDGYWRGPAFLGVLLLGFPIPVPSQTWSCSRCGWTDYSTTTSGTQPDRRPLRFPLRFLAIVLLLIAVFLLVASPLSIHWASPNRTSSPASQQHRWPGF